MEQKQVMINRKVILDLVRLMEEVQDKLESLELVSDPEFMESLRKSDEEVKNRDFVDFDDL